MCDDTVSIPDSHHLICRCGNVISKYLQYALRSSYSRHGYLKVNLNHKGKRRNEYPHRLVAKAFVHNDDPVNKTAVIHIDGDHENNSASNLIWGTHKEAMRQTKKYKKLNQSLT